MEGKKFTLAVHGGAGVFPKNLITPQIITRNKNGLLAALDAGEKILRENGTALDAVEAAVKVLEDFEYFNAGRGSVFSAKGMNQMEASIMDGKTRKAGSVIMVTKVKNPISAARKVMENTCHVGLAGEAADQFAGSQGLQLMGPQYFHTQYRYKQLLEAKKTQTILVDDLKHKNQQEQNSKKCGTVGAVALDVHGNISAATSTGGLTNKMHGRVGDTPIIGAGCYANNKTCAVSGTGQGQYFIRGVVSYDISALMQYTGASLQQAANKVVSQRLTQLGGFGGVIAVDAKGNIAMPFTGDGMYRGYVKSNGQKGVYIYEQ